MSANSSANSSSFNQSSDSNDCSPLFSSDLKCDVILGFRRAVGIISILCCIFIITVIVLFKKYKFFPQRLILYLSVSAIFQAIGYVMGDYHIASNAGEGQQSLESFCIFQGYWVLFFDWVSLLWVCCITFNIFLTAVFSHRGEKYEKFFFVVVFAISLVISFLPFIKSTYGPAGLWCWIRSTENGEPYSPGIAMQFSVFYVPFWIACIVLLAMIATAYAFVRKNRNKYEGHDRSNEIQMKLWQEEIKPLMFFPLIYIAILIFPSINRYAFGYEAEDTAGNFFFWFMHSVTLTLHGTVYALIFGCDRQTMSRLKWMEIKGAVMQWRVNAKVSEYSLGKKTREASVYQTSAYKTKEECL